MAEVRNFQDFDAAIFTIDRNHLDIEWEKQASNVFEIGRLQAQAQLYMDDLKRQLETKKSNLDFAIRRDPAKFGIAKVTEGAINSAITINPEIVDLTDKIAHAQFQVNLFKAASFALENKKKGLENLTQLIAMNYYSAK